MAPLVEKKRYNFILTNLCYNVNMDDKQLNKSLKAIEKTLGAENYAKIADEVGVIITGNKNNLEMLESKGKQIEELSSTNEKLVLANGNLLKQIPMGTEDNYNDLEKDAEPKDINMRAAFDEFGNFIN